MVIVAQLEVGAAGVPIKVNLRVKAGERGAAAQVGEVFDLEVVAIAGRPTLFLGSGYISNDNRNRLKLYLMINKRVTIS